MVEDADRHREAEEAENEIEQQEQPFHEPQLGVAGTEQVETMPSRVELVAWPLRLSTPMIISTDVEARKFAAIVELRRPAKSKT